MKIIMKRVVGPGEEEADVILSREFSPDTAHPEIAKMFEHFLLAMGYSLDWGHYSELTGSKDKVE